MVLNTIGDYRIIKERAKEEYIVVNTKGEYKNHGHFKKESTCYLVIELMKKRVVPKSDYLLQSIIRITKDKKYLERLLQVQENRKNVQMYYNVNKGRKR